jgi:hypothetical protein
MGGGDRVCGKRLKVLIPVLIDAMERHGHLDLDPFQRPAAAGQRGDDRSRSGRGALAPPNGQRKRRNGRRRSRSAAAFRCARSPTWCEPAAGLLRGRYGRALRERKTDGDFVHSLVLTDIASGWTECVAHAGARPARWSSKRSQTVRLPLCHSPCSVWTPTTTVPS